MYSCSTGTSLVKPASTRSPVASHPIARVTSTNAASTSRPPGEQELFDAGGHGHVRDTGP